MSDAIKANSAGADRALLQGLFEHPGWRVFCARFDEKLAQLEVEHWSVSTPAAEAEILRQLRAKLKDEFEPRTILRNHMLKLDAAIERDRKEQEARRETAKFQEQIP